MLTMALLIKNNECQQKLAGWGEKGSVPCRLRDSKRVEIVRDEVEVEDVTG